MYWRLVLSEAFIPFKLVLSTNCALRPQCGTTAGATSICVIRSSNLIPTAFRLAPTHRHRAPRQASCLAIVIVGHFNNGSPRSFAKQEQKKEVKNGAKIGTLSTYPGPKRKKGARRRLSSLDKMPTKTVHGGYYVLGAGAMATSCRAQGHMRGIHIPSKSVTPGADAGARILAGRRAPGVSDVHCAGLVAFLLLLDALDGLAGRLKSEAPLRLRAVCVGMGIAVHVRAPYRTPLASMPVVLMHRRDSVRHTQPKAEQR
ncbi:hypothetical protein GGX14DRAFT_406559 [Mycena pura]|uniref:Uncharacterized protein n=1 Tax=Mycena pura TaxID=153505 RepID=A0AAD6XY28_9AGAR|nr:hypothetical protein GGX14DRAFT_406559 [Mycena pura]